MAYKEVYKDYREATENALAEGMPLGDCPQKRVEEAMSYSLLGGGKRLRGVLVLAVADLCGGTKETALTFACAIEMIHTYSLIHDDLPCMDNDALRRGKPTCHIQFDEATALLAGDALLTRAFELVCGGEHLADWRKAQAVTILAKAAGAGGMIGGQQIDIQYAGTPLTPKLLDTLHSLKTGALIRAAVALGCLAGEPDVAFTAATDVYAARLGLIFQIVDDLLDVLSTEQELGKPTGSDQANGKTTYATLYGVAASRKILAVLQQEARTAVQSVPIDSTFLCDLVDEMIVRTK